MKKTSYISALLLAASALLLASCAKELGGNGNENYLGFSSNIAEIVKVKSGAGVQADTDSPARFVTLSSADGNKSLQMELSVEPNTSGLCGSDYAGTKAALQTASVSSFYAMGFNGDQKWFPNDFSTPQQVNVGQTYSSYIWVDGASYNFFAYANMPASTDVAEASITKDGVSLNYKAMPDGAADQNDILLGRYCGNGKGAGTAEMTFYHPMTAVIFKVGTLDASITAVKSISIDGVYASGSTTLASGDGTPTFTWTPSGTKEVSQTINSLPGEGDPIGVPFVLIPQDLASDNVTVNMTVTTASGDILLTTTLATGSWEPGKTYTYKVNYVGGPDPNYWVDLGMVSQSRHKLYVATYDVESIDANGNITFVDGTGKTAYTVTLSSKSPVSYTDPSGNTFPPQGEYTDPFGNKCRLMSAAEAKDIFCDCPIVSGSTVSVVSNTNITWDSNFVGESTINQNTISFSKDSRYYFPETSIKQFDADVSFSSGKPVFASIHDSSTGSKYRLRMVLEDVSKTYEIENSNVYGYSGTTFKTEIKDYSIEQKSYTLGSGSSSFNAFCPIVSYSDSDFTTYSAQFVNIENLGTIYHYRYPNGGYIMNLYNGSVERIIHLKIANEEFTFHAHGDRERVE